MLFSVADTMKVTDLQTRTSLRIHRSAQKEFGMAFFNSEIGGGKEDAKSGNFGKMGSEDQLSMFTNSTKPTLVVIVACYKHS